MSQNDDLISRQAAFDAIAVLVKEVNSRKRIESVRGKEAIEILDKYAQQELFNNNNILRHPQCANRTKLGNCDPVGGFCTSVPKEICNAQAHDVLNDTDLISRQAAIDALMEFDKKLRKINWHQYPYTEYECRGVDEAIVKIMNLPSAEPKRKKGKWVNCYTDGFGNMCKCSECGAMIDIQEKFRSFFCYHCGADMREDVLPSAQPDNQTNLCDSCNYSYPDCPSKNDDVIFGNGIGNDNRRGGVMND